MLYRNGIPIFSDILIMNELFLADFRDEDEQTYYWSQSDEKRKELFFKWKLYKHLNYVIKKLDLSIEGCMLMPKPHREIRTAKTKPRRFAGKCEHCGKPICICKAYKYLDENNAAISNSSPWLCADCYEKEYGVRIKSDVEKYKDKLISRAIYYAEMGYGFNNVDDVVRFIRAVDKEI